MGLGQSLQQFLPPLQFKELIKQTADSPASSDTGWSAWLSRSALMLPSKAGPAALGTFAYYRGTITGGGSIAIEYQLSMDGAVAIGEVITALGTGTTLVTGTFTVIGLPFVRARIRNTSGASPAQNASGLVAAIYVPDLANYS